MPELISAGKIYLAQPPLYRINVGTQTLYAQDDVHKEEVLASLPANRKPEIVRFKGLGEMDAADLKRTTIDPKGRTLLRVDIENFTEANNTFVQLLGKDASERYKAIMEDATLVDDLDV
jgi:DNA gyrase/topoisomerase IV subunit B